MQEAVDFWGRFPDGFAWQPPAGVGMEETIATICPATCATIGVYATPACAPHTPYTTNTASGNTCEEGEAITEAPIRALLKTHPDGGYVLLTVNLDAAVLRATWAFPRPLRHVQPLFENREPLELEVDEQKIFATYEPFEVHVYRIEMAE